MLHPSSTGGKNLKNPALPRGRGMKSLEPVAEGAWGARGVDKPEGI